jgi:hypothetical protein
MRYPDRVRTKSGQIMPREACAGCSISFLEIQKMTPVMIDMTTKFADANNPDGKSHIRTTHMAAKNARAIG